jgi:hypothetical protein
VPPPCTCVQPYGAHAVHPSQDRWAFRKIGKPKTPVLVPPTDVTHQSAMTLNAAGRVQSRWMMYSDRQDLIRRLKTVKPALAPRDEVLACFWFLGDTVVAYNYRIAISVPCETDFAGGVPSKLLAKLNRYQRHSVELVGGAGGLVVKAGFDSRSRFPLRPPEEFQALFTMPTMPNGAVSLAKRESSALFRGISGCMRSFGARSLVADQLGLTLIPNGKLVDFFATNGVTVSKASLDIGLRCRRRVIIPEEFCRQALALGRGAKSVRLVIADDHALMVADDVMLYGQLVEHPEGEKPYNFAATIEHYFPSSARERTGPMPNGMKDALELALAVVGKRGASEFVAENGFLDIISSSKLGGHQEDQLEFDTAASVKARFEPGLLLAGVDEFDEMLITDGCCIMTNKRGELYLVGARRREN